MVPMEKLYKKIATMFIIKNYKLWVDVKNIYNKKEIRAYDAKLNFTKKAFV